MLKIQIFWDVPSSLRSFSDSLILQMKPARSFQRSVPTHQELSLQQGQCETKPHAGVIQVLPGGPERTQRESCSTEVVTTQLRSSLQRNVTVSTDVTRMEQSHHNTQLKLLVATGWAVRGSNSGGGEISTNQFDGAATPSN
jgi:hypothetical protein